MKLHIGGIHPKEGWKILNAQKIAHVDFVGDISDLSQFDTNSIDEIYASHVLEHVPQAKALDALKGIHRVLKPGGTFYISVPDLDVLSHALINPLLTTEQKFMVMRMIFGGQIDAYDFHYFGWNQEFLVNFLREAGFSKANKVKSHGLFNDTSDYAPFGFPISLNVVANK